MIYVSSLGGTTGNHSSLKDGEGPWRDTGLLWSIDCLVSNTGPCNLDSCTEQHPHHCKCRRSPGVRKGPWRWVLWRCCWTELHHCHMPGWPWNAIKQTPSTSFSFECEVLWTLVDSMVPWLAHGQRPMSRWDSGYGKEPPDAIPRVTSSSRQTMAEGMRKMSMATFFWKVLLWFLFQRKPRARP